MSVVPLPLSRQALIRLTVRRTIADVLGAIHQAKNESERKKKGVNRRILDSRNGIRLADHALQAGKLWGV